MFEDEEEEEVEEEEEGEVLARTRSQYTRGGFGVFRGHRGRV